MGGMFNYKTHATRQESSGAGVGGGRLNGQGWVPMKDQGDTASIKDLHGMSSDRGAAKLV